MGQSGGSCCGGVSQRLEMGVELIAAASLAMFELADRASLGGGEGVEGGWSKLSCSLVEKAS